MFQIQINMWLKVRIIKLFELYILDVYLQQSNLVEFINKLLWTWKYVHILGLYKKNAWIQKRFLFVVFLLVNHNHDCPKWWYLNWLSFYIFHLGSMLLCTTSENDWIIFCGHNNFVIINFVFSKDKFYKFHYISFCFN